MNLQTFKVQIPRETLDDLQERLARTRWADEISEAGWDYGSNLSYMKELIDYWQSHFDWRAQEEEINRFAHFRTSIDNFGIHKIITVKSTGIKRYYILSRTINRIMAMCGC